MPTPASPHHRPAPQWTGRFDGDTPEHLRWHQHVSTSRPAEAQTGVALIGFACDAGVRRNQGRPGAAEGPAALRGALGSLAVHTPVPVVDLGDVVVTGDELEAGQEMLADLVCSALEENNLTVALGGGHETSWGSYLGRVRAERLQGKRVGVLNLDAHFDVARHARPSSSTPFGQMAVAEQQAGRRFDYMVAGISWAANTRALFEEAEALGVTGVLDVDCTPSHLESLLEMVDHHLADLDLVHLSVDLDVLPAAVAPGVSTPAGYGVPMEVIDAVCLHVAGSGKLAVVDVVELCPALDIESRTAFAAARLVHSIVENWRPPAF